MASEESRGPKQIIAAAKWSLQGLLATYKHEASFRLEVYLFIVLLPAAIYLAESAVQLWILVTSMMLVFIVEVINSSIEAVVDMVCGEEYHDLAKRAKDMGSAAVFLCQMVVLFSFILIIYVNHF